MQRLTGRGAQLQQQQPRADGHGPSSSAPACHGAVALRRPALAPCARRGAAAVGARPVHVRNNFGDELLDFVQGEGRVLGCEHPLWVHTLGEGGGGRAVGAAAVAVRLSQNVMCSRPGGEWGAV